MNVVCELRERVEERTAECSNLRRQGVSLEQEVRDKVSIILIVCKEGWIKWMSLLLNRQGGLPI